MQKHHGHGHTKYSDFVHATLASNVECLIVMDRVAGPRAVADVWAFYAILCSRFPADKRETHADFGPSAFGRLPRRLSSSAECGEGLVDHV
jgi:hypothetical protein